MMSNAKIYVTPTEEREFPRHDPSSGRGPEGLPPMVEHVLESVEAYGRANPLSFGLWMLGIGFVLGWKLKIW